MAAQPSQGIQTLLEAEKEAAKIVQQARIYRLERQKDARSEAEKEIQDYRKQVEASFQELRASHDGNTSSAEATIDEETNGKLDAIDAAFEIEALRVLEKVLDRVLLLEPKLHRNLKVAAVGSVKEQ